jgi:hypothetical protein
VGPTITGQGDAIDASRVLSPAVDLGAAPAPAALTVEPSGPLPAATITIKAISGKGKLSVDVGPSLPKSRNWRFRVDRRDARGSWVPVRTYRTQGADETRVVNPRAGTYRIVVLDRPGFSGATSDEVLLRR